MMLVDTLRSLALHILHRVKSYVEKFLHYAAFLTP